MLSWMFGTMGLDIERPGSLSGQRSHNDEPSGPSGIVARRARLGLLRKVVLYDCCPSARRRQWLTTARFIYAEKWGFEKNLRRALTLTSYANYGFNLVRSLRNHRVNPREILNHELELIRRGTRHEN